MGKETVSTLDNVTEQSLRFFSFSEYFLDIAPQNLLRCKIKACVHYFFINFLFLPYGNCYLFHLKSLFHSQDIQISVFPSSSLFLPVSHCFRGWSKLNVKVYGIINCRNKNLITHFVWYLEKGKGRILNLCPLTEY